jgi:hypothetical protein
MASRIVFICAAFRTALAENRGLFRLQFRLQRLMRSPSSNKRVRVSGQQGLGTVSALEAHCLVVGAININHLAWI